MTPSTPFLKSLIHEGLDGQLSLIGFPWDLGLLRSEGKTLATGLDNGPDSFRRFLDKIGPVENAEYGISLKSLSVSDYGNIRVEGSVTLEGLLDKLRAKCLSVLKKKGLPVTVGGSSDCVYGPLSAIIEHKNKGEKVLFIRISNRLDCKNMFDGDKICAESCLRKIVKDKIEVIEKKELKILYFSVDQSGISLDDETFLKEYQDSIDLVHIKNIRKTQPEMVEEFLCPITQAGVVFQKLLQEKSKEFDYIYLSIKLEALNASYCPGVSNPGVLGGLTAEEVKEMVISAGAEPKVTGIDFADYNPKFEDFRTGLLLAGLFYYFTLGYAIRTHNYT